jgi:anti-sigma regulatory factor (Ser/Thr protein kinase)
MTPPRAEARPAQARPVTATTAQHHARMPRFTPAPSAIPRDPAAPDPQWPDRWPLRSQLELAPLLTAPGCARDHATAVLREWRTADLADTAELVVSEIMTNAVLSAQAHGCPDPVRLWMLGDGCSALFLIWDATMPAPLTAKATPGDEHGRGLTIVTALSAQWGFYHPAEQPRGKVVWALLRPEPPGRSRFLSLPGNMNRLPQRPAGPHPSPRQQRHR